mmetsp:Transcript_50602/g.59110  ORF Transcript_50602/g.59110 Transcript_50602/m.59110 type:complete len:193 (+) Transcript_50602:105-683(+)
MTKSIERIKASTKTLKNGQCACCQHTVTHKKGRFGKQIPLTDKDSLNGRCLRCDPFPPNTRIAVVLKYSYGDYVGQVLVVRCPPIVGRKDGLGMFSYTNGDHYKGSFKADKAHGYGIYQYASGDTYRGQFRCGKPSGEGKYTYADGSVYSGQFRKGKKNGKGTFTQTNGMVAYDGIWNDDVEDSPLYRALLC